MKSNELLRKFSGRDDVSVPEMAETKRRRHWKGVTINGRFVARDRLPSDVLHGLLLLESFRQELHRVDRGGVSKAALRGAAMAELREHGNPTLRQLL